MELSSLPSVSSFSLCHPKPRSSATLPFLPFSNRKGAYFGYSLCKRATLRNSCNSAQNNFLRISRTHDGVSRCYFNQKEGLNRSYYNSKLHNENKLSRYIVARSEFAGTGTPDAAYSLSEIKPGSKVRGVCFYAVTAIAAILLIWFMLVLHPFVLLFDRYRRKAQHFIAKLWAMATVAPFFKIEFEGLENLPPQDVPAVYVSNHQSFLDIYTLLTLGRSFKFISKTGIFLYPIIGWAMSMMGLIPLKRMDSRSQLDCLKRCMDLIRNGASVFFFPEGTRSKDGKLGAFKKGAFSVAAKTGVPVVPMTLIGTGKIMPLGLEGVINSGSVKVVIHKPIKGSDPEILCNEARNTIADTLKHQC
ncbi:PREDICTED: 1-acyl-sn-glycerol-3-phosphate acyltransferase 1, chloroplastic [Theobroma cacao]|uniref:1-acyl-sn-glycerol-3-phosphate acyltransferase n=1 Tax=Theobroma cacao TaxID=3641 RepID=A0AB32WYN2_THECC|nr:PREDICTED: 1-acyl-sn-glycerol-3-phosphate acyltransferase 1, chloroplastic [Theobroma cacao]XP_017983203.1 PREDICTED: 1-acyl-sn-glycerol-3-phosphate acyltransferase 1, chloroplastic [Theobroma cacao]